MASNNLDSFIQSNRPNPIPSAITQEIRDRGSTFVGTIYPASNAQAAQAAIRHLKNVVHGAKPASHEITAYRCMVLKAGCTGLGGPEEFELREASDDDGEQWSARKILAVMRAEGVVDAVVIVSRWYGGILLGPARFAHIETCATEACRKFKINEELNDCLASLSALDSLVASLRAEYASLSGSTNPLTESVISTSSAPYPKTLSTNTYADLTLEKGRRLVIARENAVKHLERLIAKKKTSVAVAEVPDKTQDKSSPESTAR